MYIVWTLLCYCGLTPADFTPYPFVINTVPDNGEARLGARPSAGTIMTRFKFHILTHIPWTKWPPFRKKIFSNAFYTCKAVYFDLDVYYWSLFLGVQIDNKSALVQVMDWHWTGDKPLPEPMLIQFTDISGLDTYFFLNLSVGQPTNNMDLSEIEICLGTMIILKKSGKTVYLYIQFLFQDYCVWSIHFKGYDKCIKLYILIQNVERSKMYLL